MADIEIDKFTEAKYYLHFEDNGIASELNEYLSFFAKNFRHMPKFKMGMWDGRIRLFNINTGELPSGLIHEVIAWALREKYTLAIDPDIALATPHDKPFCDVESLVDSMNLPFTAHDYQINAIECILKHRKRLILSPTSSGKSLILYGAIRAIFDNKAQQQCRILLVVPTTSLVEQMVGDFKEYSEHNDFDADSMCHMIYSGREKKNTKPVTVTTWQSVFRKGESWFENFDAVFVDEAHLASAESITKMMDKCVNAQYRIGLTGTIEDTQTHKLTLTGLFGRVYETVSTRELMDRGLVSNLTIKALIFDHSDAVKEKVSGQKYADEIDTIISDERKNKFICKLALNQPGNTLVLFNFVERHGKPLFELATGLNTTGKTIFYVDGDTPALERERIRAFTESNNGVVIIASYGTFSTGINIKNLENVVFAHPFKSRIKILQSIGRILRKSKNSSKATLFDIANDYRWKSKVNTTMDHFKQRLQLYEKAKFDYTIKVIKL